MKFLYRTLVIGIGIALFNNAEAMYKEEEENQTKGYKWEYDALWDDNVSWKKAELVFVDILSRYGYTIAQNINFSSMVMAGLSHGAGKHIDPEQAACTRGSRYADVKSAYLVFLTIIAINNIKLKEYNNIECTVDHDHVWALDLQGNMYMTDKSKLTLGCSWINSKKKEIVSIIRVYPLLTTCYD
jgi:hypothetical protein